MRVVIPAYQPSSALPSLVDELCAMGADVLVVDDGSGDRFAAVFHAARAAGAVVLTHDGNRGKGAALKTAFAALAHDADSTDVVVTADADGQHTVTDIARVAAAARPGALVLGARGFSGDVPLRSRVGNTVARALFAATAGWRAGDTQTGLRALPSDLLPWATTLPGERFEYEQQMLLRVRRDGHAVIEVPIETVYLEHNASSHFRPVIDSLRVIAPVLLFAAASFTSFLIDTAMLALFTLLGVGLVPSVIAARLVSATYNFAVNRRIVFDRRGSTGRTRQAIRYAVLAGLLLATNAAWMTFLTGLGVPLLIAKVITEAVLFVIGWHAQRAFVFGSDASLINGEGAGTALDTADTGTDEPAASVAHITVADTTVSDTPAGRTS